jgi:outer membrane protein assembly factor BamB
MGWHRMIAWAFAASCAAVPSSALWPQFGRFGNHTSFGPALDGQGQAWTTNLTKGAIVASPVVDNAGRAYFGTDQGIIYAMTVSS